MRVGNAAKEELRGSRESVNEDNIAIVILTDV